MYEKDPRRDWVPTMKYKPWELEDLSPPELDALIGEATKHVETPVSWEELTSG